MFSFINSDIVWQDRDYSDKKGFSVPPNISKLNFP